MTLVSGLKGAWRYLKLVCYPHPVGGHFVLMFCPISIRQVLALCYFRLRPWGVVDGWMAIADPFNLAFSGGTTAVS